MKKKKKAMPSELPLTARALAMVPASGPEEVALAVRAAADAAPGRANSTPQQRSRVLADASIQDALVERPTEAFERPTVGPGTDPDSQVGPMVSQRRRHQVAGYLFLEGVPMGMVHVDHGTVSQPHVPFGGVGASGLGAYSIGSTAQEFFIRTKVAYVRG